MDNLQERIRRLQIEHAQLAAEGAPLLAEMARKREIEKELGSLGVKPDPQLAVAIARERLAAGTFIPGPLMDPGVLRSLSKSEKPDDES